MSRLPTIPVVLLCAMFVAPGRADARPGDQAVAFQINPAHTGTISGAHLDTPLAQAWSVTLPGLAAFPLIANGMVYVAAPLPNQEGAVVDALDQATGAAIWSHSFDGGASIAYDRDRLFVQDSGTLDAYDAQTGTLIWSRSMRDTWTWSFGDPVADQGTVYLSGSGDGASLYAVREDDGRMLWSRRPDVLEASDPTLDDDAVYMSEGCGKAAAYARNTGTTIWALPWTNCGGELKAMGAVANNTLLMRSEGGSAQYATHTGAQSPFPLAFEFSAPALSADTAYVVVDGTLHARPTAGGDADAWTFSGDGHLVTSPIVSDGTLYVGSSSGTLFALDAATGTLVWSADTGRAFDYPYPGQGTAGFAVANGSLVAGTGDQLTSYRTAGAIGAVPANVGAPTIDGPDVATARQAADVGVWTNQPSTYAYQWQRCDSTGSGCSDIPGETSASYAGADSDEGSTLRVVVRATNGVGDSVGLASATTPVLRRSLPRNQTAPSISADGTQGATVTASPGTWTSTPTSFSYQWYRCSNNGYVWTCAAIADATTSTHLLTDDDAGDEVYVEVTAHNSSGASDPAPSARSATIIPLPPVSTADPEIDGDPVVGEILSATFGTWSHNPTDFHVQWYRCSTQGDGCPDIPGAESLDYDVSSDDLGSYLGVEIVASNAGGDSEPADSYAIGPVVAGPPQIVTAPAISGSAQVGQTLKVSDGQWTDSPTQFTYDWYRCNQPEGACVEIAGATRDEYSPGPSDVGKYLAAVVVAWNGGGPSDPATATTGLVAAASISTPIAPVRIPPAGVSAPPPNFSAGGSITPEQPVAATLRVVSAKIGTTGVIRIEAVTGTGRLTAHATAIQGRRTVAYGTAAASTKAGLRARLSIKPSAAVRALLRRHKIERIAVHLDFDPGASGTKIARSLSLLRSAHRS